MPNGGVVDRPVARDDVFVFAFYIFIFFAIRQLANLQCTYRALRGKFCFRSKDSLVPAVVPRAVVLCSSLVCQRKYICLSVALAGDDACLEFGDRW